MICLALLGGLGWFGGPMVVTTCIWGFHNHFGDFSPRGLLVQVLFRECTAVIGFVLFGARELINFMSKVKKLPRY